MPNAKDIIGSRNSNILAVGPVKTGKTTQFLTLPGKKFIYFFDPSGVEAIQGHDVEYEEFLPQKLNITVTARPKGGGEQGTQQAGIERYKAQAFAKFEKHFENSLDNGYFDQFDVIGLDSITTLIDIMINDVQGRAGRLQYPPELADYNVAKEQLKKVLIVLCSIPSLFYAVGHTMKKQNELSSTIMNEIIIPGTLQSRAPLLFGSVLLSDYEMGIDNEKTFYMQSFKDKLNVNLGTNIPKMLPKHDVTISDLSHPQNYGLGKLLTNAYGEKSVSTAN